MSGIHKGEWSRTDHLLADLIDAVNRNTFVLTLSVLDPVRMSHLSTPEPIRRPRKQRSTPVSGEVRATIAHMRANRGSAPPHFADIPAAAESA
jgi:hypothetical protein